MNSMKPSQITSLFVLLSVLGGCSPFSDEPIPGPDKQAVGTAKGLATGMGAGAIIGAEISAGTGPGAVLGAGFGALFGMFSGLGIDLLEEDQLRRQDEQNYLRQVAWVQEVLSEHYTRRLELHPNRDIYPADWFFESDTSTLKPESKVLVREIAYLTRRRMPWSRIVVAAYNTSRDPESQYANYLTNKRAEEIALQFVKYGIEPRRVSTKSVITDEPLLIDPYDSVSRYRQAIEIIPLDF